MASVAKVFLWSILDQFKYLLLITYYLLLDLTQEVYCPTNIKPAHSRGDGYSFMVFNIA